MKEAQLQQLVRGFAEEARELVGEATRSLLSLERATAEVGRIEAFTSLARVLHTLKGSAATLGLAELSELAHGMEDSVAPFRSGAALPGTVADALLSALDAFLVRAQAEADGEKALPELVAARGLLSQPTASPPVADVEAPAAAPGEATNDVEAAAWRVSVREVAGLGREVERLRELRLRMGVRLRDLEGVVALLLRSRGHPAADQARATLETNASRMRADWELAGELVDALEDATRSISTLPVATLASALERAVREVCRTTGKQARVCTVGGELALDRRLLQALRGPLLHLVRNAVDHGIENPEVRTGRGKHHEGIVTLRANLAGNLLVLEVSDDGGGIDFERVRTRAAQLGLGTTESLASAGEAELSRLLFASGFTTRTDVSQTSGRGVGLDVVARQVQALGGTVEVHATRAEGTRFVVAVPSELGSSPLMLARVAGQVVAFPVGAIDSLSWVGDRVRAGPDRLELDTGLELVPVQEVGVLLDVRAPTPPRREDTVIVVQAQARRAAFVVDEVVGHEELMVRPLPAELGTAAIYQGAAALGSGELVLVLRPEWLVQAPPQRIARPRTEARRALVVDDSVSARSFHRNILEAAGYEVCAASSGEEALGQLGRAPFDLLVCDLGMEPMDGATLIGHLRRSESGEHLAIVVVSGRTGGVEDVPGADAFVTKRECASGRLLDAAEAALRARRAA